MIPSPNLSEISGDQFEYNKDAMEANKKIIQRWYQEDSPRRAFFDQLFSHFAPNPINVYQVGAVEQISLAWRLWSGWSDVHFGHYIKEHGGELRVIDIDEEHLRNSAFLADLFGYGDKLTPRLGRGGQGLIPKADIVYLDGSNEPDETWLQLQHTWYEYSIVVVDDWDIKGASIDIDNWPFQIIDIAKDLKMGIMDIRKSTNV